jgi:glycosyltransferase involved in cell wall biosynthesis
MSTIEFREPTPMATIQLSADQAVNTTADYRWLQKHGLKTVDVVVPCYNYARYLRDCVESVLTQPGVAVRVLVIDDSSSDNTAEVGRELAADSDVVEFRRHEVNKGHIATYNEGLLGWSTADYVVLLSADDMLAPGSLRRAVQIMEADKTIGMVYGRTIHFQLERDIPQVSIESARYSSFPGDKWLKGRCRAGHNVITSPEVVVRGSIQRSVGGYCSELPQSGDLEMWLRIAAVSDIAYVHVPQAFYRVHQASMQRTRFRGSFVDLVHRKDAFDCFFESHASDVNTADLREAANRALAREALWDACRAYDHNRVESSPVDELIDFAMNTYPKASSLSEYAALRRRQRLGATFCNRSQIFIVPAAIRWADRWWRKQRLQRYGV